MCAKGKEVKVIKHEGNITKQKYIMYRKLLL